ncbi:alpha/beta hydrolase [Umezawaea sp. Da 62-37]|uniref:alpha/beta hydrolase n=1 Tax=Umezawaea sp. Da 62-37 TaxID=3075927 RepID=UPI0028F7445E|nr:alpha/beta hydrolase [Umezawaea sp. Da 62-37]WNV86907.1 alpha/beta hydrolase [Umezawaea sp. Da 62-37]
MRQIDMTATADDGLELAGTLALPDGPGPHPAVLVLQGSGPVDRDSKVGRIRLGLGPELAEMLARHGIASLRYDRRGVGATPGDWLASGFTDNVADADAALRALGARPEVRADMIGVVGHSEGAVHAMRLGASTRVGAIVLLAGFAQPGEESLRWQGRHLVRNLPKPLRPLVRRIALWHLARIKATTTDVARLGGRRLNARWHRELLAHDPRADLVAIDAPVLAITGDKDVQVDPDDLDEIARLVPGEVEVRRIPDLTHVLRRDPGKPTVRNYGRQLKRPVDAELLEDVAAWLGGRLGTAETGVDTTGHRSA